MLHVAKNLIILADNTDLELMKYFCLSIIIIAMKKNEKYNFTLLTDKIQVLSVSSDYFCTRAFADHCAGGNYVEKSCFGNSQTF